MKKLLSLFLFFPLVALGWAPITDLYVQGSGSKLSAGATFTLESTSTFTASAGAIINISAGTVTLPSDVTRLGAAIDLGGAEVSGSLPWAGVSKSGSSLADLATRSASDLSSGTVPVARLPVFVGDSGSGGTAGIVPAPAAGDAAAGKFVHADGTFKVPPGTTTFLGLTDTPGSYSGAGNYLLRVNAGGTAIEFVEPSVGGVTDFTDLGDVPSTYAGAALKVVRVNAGETDLEFVDAAAGTKTYQVWTATEGQPTAANYATLDTRNSIAILDFDASTDESSVFVGIMPEAASLGSGLKVIIQWTATSSTSGNVVWATQIERGNTDLDSDSWDTVATATTACNGTSGIPATTTITITTIDSVTAGDLYRVLIYRDADNGSDTMTGDAELIAVELRSAS